MINGPKKPSSLYLKIPMYRRNLGGRGVGCGSYSFANAQYADSQKQKYLFKHGRRKLDFKSSETHLAGKSGINYKDMHLIVACCDNVGLFYRA